jgi:hypothetical protein
MRPSKWLVFIRSQLAGFDRSLTQDCVETSFVLRTAREVLASKSKGFFKGSIGLACPLPASWRKNLP